MDTDFRTDSSTDAVFTKAVQGVKAAQTAFRPRSIAGANTLVIIEGAVIGQPHDSSPAATPQATDTTRQLTARSARRIVHHAAISVHKLLLI